MRYGVVWGPPVESEVSAGGLSVNRFVCAIYSERRKAFMVRELCAMRKPLIV
jgi:hypothetical protein